MDQTREDLLAELRTANDERDKALEGRGYKVQGLGDLYSVMLLEALAEHAEVLVATRIRFEEERAQALDHYELMADEVGQQKAERERVMAEMQATAEENQRREATKRTLGLLR